jgi:hypothetical protein
MVSNIMLSVMALVTNTVGYAIAKFKEERGQDLLEYAVLAGGIAIAAGAVILLIDPQVFQDFADQIEGCVGFDPDECGL